MDWFIDLWYNCWSWPTLISCLNIFAAGIIAQRMPRHRRLHVLPVTTAKSTQRLLPTAHRVSFSIQWSILTVSCCWQFELIFCFLSLPLAGTYSNSTKLTTQANCTTCPNKWVKWGEMAKEKRVEVWAFKHCPCWLFFLLRSLSYFLFFFSKAPKLVIDLCTSQILLREWRHRWALRGRLHLQRILHSDCLSSGSTNINWFSFVFSILLRLTIESVAGDMQQPDWTVLHFRVHQMSNSVLFSDTRSYPVRQLHRWLLLRYTRCSTLTSITCLHGTI
jgi:hypothetical protein